MKAIKSLKFFLGGLVFFGQLSSGNALAEVPMPSQLLPFYSSTPNPLLSDSFNGASLDESKWQYRWASNGEFAQKSESFTPVGQPGMSKSYVELMTDDNGNDDRGYVSIRGSHNANRGSGITTINSMKYGFYTVRWNTENIDNNSPSRWHPAVWAAGCDFSVNISCVPEVTNKLPRVEIDFMEGIQSSTSSFWDSHNLMWKSRSDGSSYVDKIYRLKSRTSVWPQAADNVWETMGVEYNPEYIRVWLYDENQGWRISGTQPFSDGPSTGAFANDVHRASIYWILSNKRYTVPEAGQQDSALNVDFFYAYDHTGGSYDEGANSVVNGGSYTLKSAYSNTFLTLDLGAAENSDVRLNSERPDDITQKWIFTKFSGGGNYYSIKSAHSERYLRCRQNGETDNGKNIVVHGSMKNWATLKWTPVPISGQFVFNCAYEDQNMRGYDPYGLPRSGDGAAVTMFSPYNPKWNTFKWVLIEAD